LSLPEAYYDKLRNDYNQRRGHLLSSLEEIGFECVKPRGAYYIWSDFSELDRKSNDIEFAKHLVKKIGVAVVPGSSFFYKSNKGKKKVRFTFSKRIETIDKACERLASI
jgi:aminotransferase